LLIDVPQKYNLGALIHVILPSHGTCESEFFSN
jgi:hypothetical protein